ncbi:AdoMet-dependent rRNA methyltransferase spb-1 [Tuber borchii]|uniref:AdoMet-dependent rRNA methyltransferase spb-1 n=1 Tax=Tuber borchii TaxID=42251 RepID=A0A2T7A0R0_TUBBO|nr:AdoMet-dependent rRNA methyltransferase spb-1 [Tuber borchii]
MAIQKKHGKGRLDKWYKLAKQKGYRARAAFKLIQLNKKYNFLEKSKVLIDLCAAPGSWCQVAAECMPVNSLIVGVDLAPIKAIPRVITFQSDITTDKCRATLRGHLKTWKADTVLHDGAPNVGIAWVQDAFTQAELVLQSLKLATEFLIEGGTFVTKVFRSRDFNNLMWVFNQLFTKVEATKPPSSRSVSAEIFVVCRGYKAPKRVDPKFLDPRTVFEELPDPAPNNEAKVFNPEIKKRKRDGYEEGDYLQFKEVPVNEFIETTDPIQMLGSLNRLSFKEREGSDLATVAISKMPETTKEIRHCCDDLRVLGKKEFRALLKWRLSVREKFDLAVKKANAKSEVTETAEITPMDEEMQIEEELERLKMKELGEKKRSRRRENERKQKEIVRLQLHMTTPTDIGLGQDAEGESMFAIKNVDRAGALDKVTKGKMNIVVEEDHNRPRKDIHMGDAPEDDSEDETADKLEAELDGMYEQYKEKKAEADAKYKAKKARQEHEDGEWEGIKSDAELSDDEVAIDAESSEGDDSEGEDNESEPKKLITHLDGRDITGEDGLSKKAAMFFDQEIFQGIAFSDLEGEESEEEAEEEDEAEEGEEEAGDDIEMEAYSVGKPTGTRHDGSEKGTDDSFGIEEEEGEDTGIEIIKAQKDDSWDAEEEPIKNGKLNIDIITAEAMSLAQRLAVGKSSAKANIIDDGFNKYSFRDRDGLPDWFLDDENKHSKPNRPITAAGAAAIKEKLRALNARPIKKVREAKDRKKFKAAQRLEKLRKKSALMADEEGTTEKEKAANITKLMAKAGKKKPKAKVKVVVARGPNKGQGRPKGVKGRYKVVDARLKKDVRAQKRIAKRDKKR